MRPEAVFESIRETVEDAVDEAVRRSGSPEHGLLAGALELALERCGRPVAKWIEATDPQRSGHRTGSES
jgi:hypothetical protein